MLFKTTPEPKHGDYRIEKVFAIIPRRVPMYNVIAWLHTVYILQWYSEVTNKDTCKIEREWEYRNISLYKSDFEHLIKRT